MSRHFLLTCAGFSVFISSSPAQPQGAQNMPLPSFEIGASAVTNLCGIGAVINGQGGQAVIKQCLNGSGAQAAGLLPDDVILNVNGTDIAGLDLETIVGMIRGKADTTVLLKIARAGGQPFEVIITRHPVIVPP